MQHIQQSNTPKNLKIDAAGNYRETACGIKDFLQAFRQYSGGLPVVQERFRLEEILQSIENLFIPMCREKGLEMKVNQMCSQGMDLFGNTLCIRQILTNLVDNALKHSKAQKLYIEGWLEADSIHSSQYILLLMVQDNGQGIPEEKQKHICCPFVQGHDPKQGAPGLGLGLAIVQDWISKMQGDLQLQSALGEGTSVCCSLPVQSWYE